jgi:hypothetical protein
VSSVGAENANAFRSRADTSSSVARFVGDCDYNGFEEWTFAATGTTFPSPAIGFGGTVYLGPYGGIGKYSFGTTIVRFLRRTRIERSVEISMRWVPRVVPHPMLWVG